MQTTTTADKKIANPNAFTSITKSKSKTTTKLTATAVRRFSDKTISTKITKWNGEIKTENSRIATTQSSIDKYQKQLDTANDELGKKNGYNDAKDAYNQVDKELTTAEAKFKKAKTKADQKKIKADIKALTAKKKTAYNNLVKLSSSSKSAQTKMTTALRKLASLKKTLTGQKGVKTKYKGYLALYQAEKKKRDEAARKALQKKNSAAISKKISEQRKKVNNGNAGQTAIYRADKMKSTVYFFGEKDPSESNNNNVASKAVDNGDPRSRYSRRDTKELSGTYIMFGKDPADLDKKFDAFQKWQRYGYEVCVRGFSKWAHVQMAQVTKGTLHYNALEVTIQFDYVKQQKIQFKRKKAKSGSSKSKKKTVGAKSTKKGTGKSKTGKLYVTVKSSKDTMYAVSQTKNVALSTIEKLNAKDPTKLQIGDKIRYQ